MKISGLLTLVIVVLQISNTLSLKNSFTHPLAYFQYKLETALHREANISYDCRSHLAYYSRGLNAEEEWAVRMFDANAMAAPSGILEGNRFELGSYEECLSIKKYEQGSKISGKYCIGRTFVDIPARDYKLNSKSLLTSPARVNLFLAKCFPRSCSIAEMEKMFTAMDNPIEFSEEICQTRKPLEFTGGAIATMIVFATVVAIVIFSTSYEAVCHYSGKDPSQRHLVAFSLITNFKKIISVDSGQLTCLHGIRVISMMWIVLGHRTYTLSFFPIRNLENFRKWNENATYTTAPIFAVEPFFLISGLLVSYNYMTNKKKGVKFNILSYYFKRYMRLTPVIAALIPFTIYLFNYTGYGPLWSWYVEPEIIRGCQVGWWQTLLYMQNIYNPEGFLCVYPSWFLSIDMQLFILSPLLLFPLKRWPRSTIFLTTLLAVCSNVAGLLNAWTYDLNPYILINSGKQVYDFYRRYYHLTHTRASTWLLGIILGYIIFGSKEKKVAFLNNKVLSLTLWTISMMTLVLLTSLGPNWMINKMVRSLHIGFAKSLWSVALGWIIFVCVNGRGGVVNWFLSNHLFHVLSKFTYVLFLTNWIIVTITISNIKTTPQLDALGVNHDFWGDYMYSLGIGLFLTMTIELPVVALMK